MIHKFLSVTGSDRMVKVVAVNWDMGNPIMDTTLCYSLKLYTNN